MLALFSDSILICKTEWITPLDIHLDIARVANPTPISISQDQHSAVVTGIEMEDPKGLVEATEKGIIVQALHEAKGNRTKAAKLLNISRSTLYYKLRKYNIKEQNNFS